MSGLGGNFGRDFARETWTLYAFGVFGAILRFTARIRRLGIRHLQTDDYIMCFGLVWYTILCVALNEVASGGGSNLMTPEQEEHITPAIRDERVRGSKWVFVSEHAFILCVWSCKACMLVIYARITEGLKQRKWINYIAVYVGLGFLATELSLFLMCRPLTNYWAVPSYDYQCSSYQYYEIVQGCFSISADCFMLLVAIPMLVQVRVPMKQKLILVLLFGMGIFVIVAAVLNKVYCLDPALISYVYMNWYFREATVAILVTNLPLVWSLLRDVFPVLKSWTGGSKRGTDRFKSGAWTSKGGSRPYGPSSQLRSGEFDMHDFPHRATATPSKDPAVSDISLTPTEERDVSSDDGSARALRIRQDITVTVQRDTRPPEYQSSTAHAVSGHEEV
ncbi:uncharacterized protein N7498_005822 [Penicillium cinerascens]|uniref:Rhodopsin domain-containing protein n=1 Tax=Penicillium cinerascens TaxID=70096 RepID=A0A9W9MPB0_9EURO|nr:uncharacterized protein N7498_005822 [Penicillium cinerascens]KAJ5204943.1 hypothetical protein N7498_005822 [Penicillium cinerascens]